MDEEGAGCTNDFQGNQNKTASPERTETTEIPEIINVPTGQPQVIEDEKKEKAGKLDTFHSFFKSKMISGGEPSVIEPCDIEHEPHAHSKATNQQDQKRGENVMEQGFYDLFSSKRNVAQGMMDLALITANASQLRYVLQTNANGGYYVLSLVLIAISIFLQIAVGLLLLFIRRYTFRDNTAERQTRYQALNDATVFIMFMILVVNIFIAAFGVTSTSTPQNSNPKNDTQLI